mgnify:FL=1
MRSTNSIKNAITAVISNVVTILIGIVSQAIFIKTLGAEYLGINGLFTNIVSMLGIVELGIGSAIIYNLYEPIAKDDKEKIKSLMNLYKKSYRVIAVIVFIIGMMIIPFLKNIVGDISIDINIEFIYSLFIIDVVASYLLTYKRSILYANQKTYITNIVHIGYLIVMNTLQIVILLIAKNFIAYLMIKIICRILENIVITIIANRKYPYIKEKNVKKIDKKTTKDIIKKVKGLIFHKVGSFVVLGTDNIIISKFLGVVTVGLYSNYNMIIQAVSNLFLQVFDSLIASVGNLLVEGNCKKSYEIYKNMLMINSILFTFATTEIICLIEPFIKVWIGEQYILSKVVLIILMVNFYIQGMRKTCLVFKMAAGIFHEDRYFPIIESIINIIVSVILVKIIGLPGVFLGTIVSTLPVILISYPKYVYIPLFHKSFWNYVKENAYYYILAFITVSIAMIVTSYININNLIVKLIVNAITSSIIFAIMQYIFFHNKSEYKYLKNMLKNFILKIKGKNVYEN